MRQGDPKRGRRRFPGGVIAIAVIAAMAFVDVEPARAGDHDFWSWRDGYGGPVYGYWLGPPAYGYYYPAYGPGGYPVIGFYAARDYYSYYYGRTDFGYQDTK